ncbi:MAG: hypothetical protein P8M72_09940 [Gammaproteobacteria bacterium]|nr:hypothetical protein [Gammaproteobacteria bacterium]
MKFDDIKLPNNKNFGIFLATVLFILGIYLGYSNDRLWLLMIPSILILGISFTKPNILTPFNKIWMSIGFILSIIARPIMMAIIYFGLITPVSVITRIFGRDELNLKSKNKESYWTRRDPLGPAGDSFKNQF